MVVVVFFKQKTAYELRISYEFRRVLFRSLESWKMLAALEPVIFNGINPLADQLAAGAFAFVPHATLDTAVNKRRKRGAPIEWNFPEPGLGIPYFMGIASNAPHPAAAKLFMAWSLTGAGQTIWVNRSGIAPPSDLANYTHKLATAETNQIPQ